MTNFERIKAMSLEQFVRFHTEDYRMERICTLDCDSVDAECSECLKAWLEREVQDEAD